MGRGTVRSIPARRPWFPLSCRLAKDIHPHRSCLEDVLFSHIAWTILKNKFFFFLSKFNLHSKTVSEH